MSTPAPKEYYYANAEGQPAGPHTAEVLRELRHKEILSDETWVIEAGGTEWIPYHTLGTSVTVPPVPPETTRSSVFLQRIVTLVVLLLIFTVLFAGISVAVAAAIVTYQGGNPITVSAIKQTGQSLVLQDGAITQKGYIFLGGSVVAALIVAGLLSFSSLFPWCRPATKRLAKK